MARRRFFGVLGTVFVAIAALMIAAPLAAAADGPSGLAASSPTKAVKLTWFAGTEKTDIVERATGGGDFVAVKTIGIRRPGSAKSFTDKTVTLGQIYTYRVKGVPLTGAAVYSESVTVTSGPVFAPNPTLPTTTTSAPATTTTTTTTSPPSSGEWTKRYGGSHADRAQAVATDPAGNVALLAKLEGSVSLGGADIDASIPGFAVARYSPTGGHLWSHKVQIAGTGTTNPTSVATDARGDVIVVGTFTGTVNLGGGTLTAIGDNDLFVAKYAASNGSHLWTQRFGQFGGWANPTSVAVNSSGKIAVAGYTAGGINIGAAFSGPVQSPFVAVYDGNANGAPVFAKRLPATVLGRAMAVAIAPDGGVAVTGYFQGELQTGSSLTSTKRAVEPKDYTEDVFVARYNASGGHVWSKRFGATFNDRGAGVTFANNGDVVVAGEFVGTVNFGGEDLEHAKPDYIEVNPFVARYGPNGGHVWSFNFDAGSVAQGLGGKAMHVAATTDGGFALGGELVEPIKFGTSPLTPPAARSNDVFAVKLRSDGTHVWSQRYGGSSSNDRSAGIAPAPDGGAVTAHTFYESATKQEDVVVTRLAP